MTVVSPTVLEVTLKAPQGQWDRQVANQLAMIGSPTALQADAAGFATKPVGAGPFTVESWTPNEKMVLKRNPTYWNAPKPYIDELTYQVIPDDAQR